MAQERTLGVVIRELDDAYKIELDNLKRTNKRSLLSFIFSADGDRTEINALTDEACALAGIPTSADSHESKLKFYNSSEIKVQFPNIVQTAHDGSNFFSVPSDMSVKLLIQKVGLQAAKYIERSQRLEDVIEKQFDVIDEDGIGYFKGIQMVRGEVGLFFNVEEYVEENQNRTLDDTLSELDKFCGDALDSLDTKGPLKFLFSMYALRSEKVCGNCVVEGSVIESISALTTEALVKAGILTNYGLEGECDFLLQSEILKAFPDALVRNGDGNIVGHNGMPPHLLLEALAEKVGEDAILNLRRYDSYVEAVVDLYDDGKVGQMFGASKVFFGKEENQSLNM